MVVEAVGEVVSEDDIKAGAELRGELVRLLMSKGCSELDARIAVEELGVSAFGENWRESLQSLEAEGGLQGTSVAKMLVRFSALLVFPPQTIQGAADI